MIWQSLKRSISSWTRPEPVVAPVGDHMKLGEWGEQVAADYLIQRGYVILDRRWRHPPLKGEVDLIAQDKNILVFVEVKTRRSKDYLVAEAAVHWAKKRTIVSMAHAYARHKRRRTMWRYDVMSVYPSAEPGGEPSVEHFIDAFQEADTRRWRRY